MAVKYTFAVPDLRQRMDQGRWGVFFSLRTSS